MKTLKKIIEKTIILTAYFTCANIDTLAGAVDIVTDGKTNLELKWTKFINSKLKIDEEEP